MTDEQQRRILAIGAHPDDIEFCCAGTLARCIQRGDAVTMAVVCRGDSASCGLSREELMKVRSAELQASANVLGADLIEMGYLDYGVYHDRDTVMRFTDVIRRARPDIIITHCGWDYGGDHNNTHLVTVDASIAASVQNVFTDHPPIERIPLLYMMEPTGSFNFQPEIYVDITETLDLKQRMMECHASQMQWMRRYSDMDSVQFIETVSRFRGYQAGVKYAEGFITHKSFARFTTERMLP